MARCIRVARNRRPLPPRENLLVSLFSRTSCAVSLWPVFSWVDTIMGLWVWTPDSYQPPGAWCKDKLHRTVVPARGWGAPCYLEMVPAIASLKRLVIRGSCNRDQGAEFLFRHSFHAHGAVTTLPSSSPCSPFFSMITTPHEETFQHSCAGSHE